MINLFELDSNLVRDPFTAKLAFCVCMVSPQILRQKANFRVTFRT